MDEPQPRAEREGADPRAAARGAERALARLDPFLGAQLIVAAALALDVFLPQRVTLGPRWLVPSIEGALLAALLLSTPHPRLRHSPLRRNVTIGLIGLLSAVNTFSLIALCRSLLHGGLHNGGGRALIFAGILLWVTNVLLFALWYWQLDRGGPLERPTNPERKPDFLFPQTERPELGPPGWEPGLIDYLYVSFTNATAFSPTDTMPLTPTAKLLMAIQSLTSMLIVALVVARAVNILS